MKKILYRFLSTGMMLVTLSSALQFFIPQQVHAVTASEILRCPVRTTDCLETMLLIVDYIEQQEGQQKVLSDANGDTGLIWDNHLNVSKALILIIYKILASQINESSVRDFYNPKERTTISLRYYIEKRFLEYTAYNGADTKRVSRAVIIGVLMYLDEIQRENANEKTGTLFMEWSNIHRLFFAAFVVSAKFWEDGCCSNNYMARVGGVTTEHLDDLEVCFLKRIHYNLFFSDLQIKVYADLFEHILKKIPNLDWDLNDDSITYAEAQPASHGVS